MPFAAKPGHVENPFGPVNFVMGQPSPRGIHGGPNSSQIRVLVILLPFFDFCENFAVVAVLQRKNEALLSLLRTQFFRDWPDLG